MTEAWRGSFAGERVGEALNACTTSRRMASFRSIVPKPVALRSRRRTYCVVNDPISCGGGAGQLPGDCGPALGA